MPPGPMAPNVSSALTRVKRKVRTWMPHLTYNIVHFPERLLRGRPIKAFWSNLELNFGDAITPVLLRYYGYTPVHSFANRAHLTSTGSVLHMLPDTFAGTILGSGFIAEERAKQFPAATVISVRGAYTRDLLHAPRNTPLGDPGLLLPQLLKQAPAKRFLIGLVPHYADKPNKSIWQICENHASKVQVIDVQREPVDVMNDIAQCEYILSSSLHGLVVADALGIPNGWLVLSDLVTGGGFKFRDYYSAFDASHEPVSLVGDEGIEQLVQKTHQPSPRISAVQAELDKHFKELWHLVSS